MNKLTDSLAECVLPLNGKLIGDSIDFYRVGIDTREFKAGDLFVAISGERFDGHDFLVQAQEKGAAAALVEKPVALAIPQLVVANTRIALGQLAALRRKQLQQLNVPVVAMTGSCGKTTCRAMTENILQQLGSTHASIKSFNNEIGMPLTLLTMEETDRYVVLELGANHPGEISYLTGIAKPDVCGITLAAPVHLDGFKTIAGVIEGKGELFQGLTDQGIGLINQDEQGYGKWVELCKPHKFYTFSETRVADFYATDIKENEQGVSFILHTPVGECEIHLSLLGRYNVVNALLAVGLSVVAGANLEAIKQGLETVSPVNKRMNRRVGVNNSEIFDDTYNANPKAVEAALSVLAHSPGKKILVLGDMGELGEHASDYHAQVGVKAREYGIAQLISLGTLAKNASESFGPGGQHFTERQALIDWLKPKLEANCHVLIKGSRAMAMEHIVEALSQENN